ncbi:VOC family protein [Nitriliruptoraceae bacterium ZYF776]|nr:VOC family protein [Profundirhabdus halotolerans]
MQGITPHLWYDTQAVEAAELYVSTFPDSRILDVTTLPDTPSGDTDQVRFELFGQPFLAISAGPHFRFTPAISFAVSCVDADELDRYWEVLVDGGEVLMELGAYPFSSRYGWTTDRFGLSWQLSVADGPIEQRIVPSLLFVGDRAGQATDAMAFYTSVFPDADIDTSVPYPPDAGPDAGHLMYGSFRLAGQRFAAMDSGSSDHRFGFNEAVSFLVDCEDQAEMDRYTEALSAVPEAEQCGWLADRFGVSWQINPGEMHRMLAEGSPEQVARVVQAFLPMKRLDLAVLRRAYADPVSA